MRKIGICDMTLAKRNDLSFKEKIEVARQLENLTVDVIELNKIDNVRTDTLFCRTVSAFVKNSVLSVSAGDSVESVGLAAAALNSAAKPRIRVELPVSIACMVYNYNRKPEKMLALIHELVAAAKEKCGDVEFCAVDATRAETPFLISAINAAVNAGATAVTVCDTAGDMLPDAFADFVREIKGACESLDKTAFGVSCCDKNGFAAASAILAAKSGADFIKTVSSGKEYVSLETVANIIKNCGDKNGMSSSVKYTEISRGTKQIRWIAGEEKTAAEPARESVASELTFSAGDTAEAIIKEIRRLGYELSDEDNAKVYDEFARIAAKKTVTSKELDAIVASTALQVPPAYKLVSYVINNGNIITASAQIKLEKDGRELAAIGIGDGPVDAAFRTIEQIVGGHFELDDFRIQAVTEGKEATGNAVVRLRSNGKLYSGNGISTDIIGASIRAYVNAINKIVYEEG